MTVLGPAEEPEVLPMIEIETEEPFYTFRAHYDPARRRCARPSSTTRPRAGRAGGGPGLPGGGLPGPRPRGPDPGRDSTPQILEINTIPGLTETGPTRYAAQAAGMDFTELIGRVISRVTG